MTGNSVVRACIDEHTKREAAAALKKIGLTVSDAFRLLPVRVAFYPDTVVSICYSATRRISCAPSR